MGTIIVPILWIATALMCLGTEFTRHGEVKKSRKYNGWTSLIATAIVASFLYWGGFFDELLRRLSQ